MFNKQLNTQILAQFSAIRERLSAIENKDCKNSFLTSNGKSNKVKARSAIKVLEWMVLASSEEGQMKVKARSRYNSIWVDAEIKPHSKVK